MHIMNKSGQVVMKKDLRNEIDIVSTISGRFRTLIRNLVQGNTRMAHSIAEAARQGISTDGSRIAFQNLIEDMAQDQALRNALINLPSAVPGIGTLISLGLISVIEIPFFPARPVLPLRWVYTSLSSGRL